MDDGKDPAAKALDNKGGIARDNAHLTEKRIPRPFATVKPKKDFDK
jgi:hypothetical protein